MADVPPAYYPPEATYQQGSAYPPPQQGYPPQEVYPPQQGYPPQAAYPPQPAAYPPQPVANPPQPASYPSAPPTEPTDRGYAGAPASGGSAPTGEVGGFSAQASFNDKKIRHAFIRKVYLILSTQLIVTFAIVAIFFFVDPVRNFIKAHSFLYWIAYAIFLGTYITLVCCGNVRRKSPGNMIALSIFTLALSYMAGTITSYYTTDGSDGWQTVLIALGITIGVTIGVTIFSIQTRFDFTGCGGFLFIFSWSLFIFGFVAIIFAANGMSVLYTVYAWLAAVLFTMFLAYDTQLLIGGRKYELSPEEYVYAALQLYVDIVYIFLIILSLFGGGSR